MAANTGTLLILKTLVDASELAAGCRRCICFLIKGRSWFWGHVQKNEHPVWASELAAGVFLSLKRRSWKFWHVQRITNPAEASELAAGAFFSGKKGIPGCVGHV